MSVAVPNVSATPVSGSSAKKSKTTDQVDLAEKICLNWEIPLGLGYQIFGDKLWQDLRNAENVTEKIEVIIGKLDKMGILDGDPNIGFSGFLSPSAVHETRVGVGRFPALDSIEKSVLMKSILKERGIESDFIIAGLDDFSKTELHVALYIPSIKKVLDISRSGNRLIGFQDEMNIVIDGKLHSLVTDDVIKAMALVCMARQFHEQSDIDSEIAMLKRGLKYHPSNKIILRNLKRLQDWKRNN